VSPTPPEDQSWWNWTPGALHGVEWFQSSLDAMR